MALRVRIRKSQPERLNQNSSNLMERNEEEELEEPVTPAGRMFIQPQTSCTIISIFGLQNPADIPVIKEGIAHSLAQHKRFCSIIKPDKNGKEQWVRTRVNIDDHIIVPTLPEAVESATAAEEYAAELALAPPLDPTRPLWELHILNVKSKNSAASAIFRIHHSLGDGTSLMSLFIACTRNVRNPEELPSLEPPRKKQPRQNFFLILWNTLCRIFLLIWYTLTEVTRFTAVSLFIRDGPTPIKGGPGVERMAKQIVCLDVSLEDLKAVKNAAKTTINDVLLGVVSAGLTRYLREKLQKKSLKGIRMHATGLVNTRRIPGVQELAEMMEGSSKVRWGNNMGYLIIPISLEEHEDPLQYVRSAKKITDKKKLSLEAPFTYTGGAVIMKLAGVKVASDFTYKTLVQTTLSISNVMGPSEQVQFHGNPVTSIAPTVVGQPQALCIHLQTYAGKATLVVTVAKDIIPDPHAMLDHFRNALQEMKQAATIGGR